MAAYQEPAASYPAPDLLLSPDVNSEGEEQEGQQEERPFKIEYVPLARGAYTELPVAMVPTLEFGGNFFSQMLPFEDSKIIYRALLQRCHRDEQLHKRRFLFLGPDGQPTRNVKLPLGINLDDFEASPQVEPYALPKRWAVAIDCEMVGVAPPPPAPGALAASKTPARCSQVGRGTPTISAQAGRGRGGGTSLGSPAQLNRGRGRAAATTSTNNTPTAPKGPPKPCATPFERSELAQLCAVDVITGEVLVNVLVQPQGRVVNWLTRYSGITPQALREAKAQGNLVTGWEQARSLLLEHVDSSTILVGHSIDNDLPMLRLAHTRIVDTALQTAEAVYGAVDHFPRIWALRDLLRDLAGITVQNHGRRGHSCLEDTLATRELALWGIRFPRRLEDWGRAQRRLLETQAVEREAQRVAREEKAAKDKEKKAAKDKEESAAAAAAAAATAAEAEHQAVDLKHDVQKGDSRVKRGSDESRSQISNTPTRVGIRFAGSPHTHPVQPLR